MASLINTGNIDTTFPIAGQDNDSSGFRNNFTNINTNFVAAKSEIEDLQTKAILKSALSGTTLNNDFAGALISNAQIQGFRETVNNLGSVTGTVTLDVSVAPYYKIATGGAITLAFQNYSPAGTYSEVALEVDVTNIAHTITLPTITGGYIGLDSLVDASGDVITVQSVGTYVYRFSTSDAGSTILIENPAQSRIAKRIDLVSAPLTSIGATGDKKGMIAYDASYVYVCTADYDGVTSIWIRSLASTW